MKPYEIEQRSFEIIDAEAGPHDFSPPQWFVVRRMIHTSADFEYMQTIRMHPLAVEAGVAVIRRGCTIFCDTRMLHAGIRSRDLSRFGATAECLMDDPQIAEAALENGVTLATAAVDAVAERMADGIYAVGNAPTALLRLVELIRQGRACPALVIGLPVGFVNAAESKAALSGMDVPYITNVSRKGGSNLAAGVVNALLLLALQEG